MVQKKNREQKRTFGGPGIEQGRVFFSAHEGTKKQEGDHHHSAGADVQPEQREGEIIRRGGNVFNKSRSSPKERKHKGWEKRATTKDVFEGKGTRLRWGRLGGRRKYERREREKSEKTSPSTPQW